jgi:hypothetical protein
MTFKSRCNNYRVVEVRIVDDSEEGGLLFEKRHEGKAWDV